MNFLYEKIMISEMKNNKEFYDRVGREIGWDFSRLEAGHDGEKWDFYGLVKDRLREESVLLDLGTGGGKKVLSLAGDCLMIVGIDNSEEMIKKAWENASETEAVNCRFFKMDANSLTFPDSFFDAVSCRQAAYNPDEVFRVLTNGGFFMTQQVSPDDKEGIKDAFGRGQEYGKSLQSFKKKLREEVVSAGFRDVELDHYKIKEYLRSEEDLKFLLKNTPILEDFGREGDMKLFSKFVRDKKTDKGIETVTCRVLVSGKK